MHVQIQMADNRPEDEKKNEIDQRQAEIIKELETYLDSARRGDLEGILIVASHAKTDVSWHLTTPKRNELKFVGIIHRLLFQLHTRGHN